MVGGFRYGIIDLKAPRRLAWGADAPGPAAADRQWTLDGRRDDSTSGTGARCPLTVMTDLTSIPEEAGPFAFAMVL